VLPLATARNKRHHRYLLAGGYKKPSEKELAIRSQEEERNSITREQKSVERKEKIDCSWNSKFETMSNRILF
jgi:hypothetical protein